MTDIAFEQQNSFYDGGYATTEVGDKGFPDLKIVDYNTTIVGKKILNIGGGNAADTWFLAGKNQITALDGSSVAVGQARAKGVAAQVVDVSQPLDFVDGNFDIVVIKDILEHIYNSLNLLQEAKRVVKPDGYIIISLPNHFYFPFRLRLLFGKNLIWKSLLHDHTKSFEEWNYMHIRFFTWSGVKKMIRQVGLTVEKSYWDFGTLAHYSDPLMYEYAFQLNAKQITSKKQWLLYKVLVPAFKIFNIIFPKKLRACIVSLAPGLLCAGFYLRLRK